MRASQGEIVNKEMKHTIISRDAVAEPRCVIIQLLLGDEFSRFFHIFRSESLYYCFACLFAIEESIYGDKRLVKIDGVGVACNLLEQILRRIDNYKAVNLCPQLMCKNLRCQ